MKTPAGRDCRYYYEDFHRGRSKQECRLVDSASAVKWKVSDCAHCPIPQILWANASPDLLLDAAIRRGFMGIGRRVAVTARCRKHAIAIADPYVGCDHCAAERPNLADLTTDSAE